ncbi:MAG: hypothetical protein HOP02_08420 [Methylococcaceae bacterium]|nr:hypothetical protein [Methylococcaceae bacterium]
MDLENLVRYLPDLYIPDIVLLKPNEIDNERWLLRMLFDKESAITFMRGKESDYICCGQQKSKISKNKWGDNYQLNWWLNEYFENKRIEDFSQKEKDTLIELLDKIDRVFKPINERHQNPPNDQIVIYA